MSVQDHRKVWPQKQAEETLPPSSLVPTTPTQSAQDQDLASFPASQGPSQLWLIFPPKVTGEGADISEEQPTGAGLLVSAGESHYFFYSTHCLGRCTPRLTSAYRPEALGHAPSVAHLWFAVDSEEALEGPMVSLASFPFKREGRGQIFLTEFCHPRKDQRKKWGTMMEPELGSAFILGGQKVHVEFS